MFYTHTITDIKNDSTAGSPSTLVFFSPSGGTKKISAAFAETFSPARTLDLLKQPLRHKVLFEKDELVIIALPVYSGRAAPVALDSIRMLQGQGTPAVILVTYGNRAYDDALLEMLDVLCERGFVMAGAGAFISRHSVFPRFAADRPDSSDYQRVKKFARDVAAKLEIPSEQWDPLCVPGTRPYRRPVDFPLYPRAGKKCVRCGACAAICPVRAINRQHPNTLPNKKCISCSACIHVCPRNARDFGGPLYIFFDQTFAWIFKIFSLLAPTSRKEPEVFI